MSVCPGRVTHSVRNTATAMVSGHSPQATRVILTR
jgi:hypothetical protein